MITPITDTVGKTDTLRLFLKQQKTNYKNCHQDQRQIFQGRHV